MLVLLHVVYVQSCYPEYVTLMFSYLSFHAGSLRINIRIRCFVTVYFHVRHVLADYEKTYAECQRLYPQRQDADLSGREKHLQTERARYTRPEKQPISDQSDKEKKITGK